MTKNTGGLYKPLISTALAAAIVAVLSASVMRADVITGPSLTTSDSGYRYSGVGFTATINSTLTGFTLQNQGQADTVILVDSLGNILDSVATPVSTPSYTATVNWALTAGSQYYLLQSTLSNSHYASWGIAAPSDTQIALFDTGDFSFTSPASANFTFGGAGSSSGTAFWAAFNNITTTGGTSAVPEPASLTLVLPAALGMFWFAKRKRLIRFD